MKLSFPVREDKELDSELHNDFCDAKGYLIFDTETEEYKYINNMCPSAEHDNCKAVQVFGGGEKVDVVIINGISLMHLKTSRMLAYRLSVPV